MPSLHRFPLTFSPLSTSSILSSHHPQNIYFNLSNVIISNYTTRAKRQHILKKLRLSAATLSKKDSLTDFGALKEPSLSLPAKNLSRNRNAAINTQMNALMGADQLGNSVKFEKKEKKRLREHVMQHHGRKLHWEQTEKKKVTKFANDLYRRTFAERKRHDIGVNSRFRAIKPSAKKVMRVKKMLAGNTVGKSMNQVLERNMLKKWDQKMRTVFGRKRVRFIAAASAEESIPTWTKSSALPEFAFIGRSNVGKSSLLNTIGLSKQARVDARPGKTQTINFYNLNDYIMLVDLPGYGFAYSYEKDEWYKLTTKYLAKRSLLKRVFVLVDSRHGIKPSDREIMEHLDKNGRAFQVILTKNDLVPSDDLARRLEMVEKEIAFYRFAIQNVLLVSTRTESGVYELRRTLLGMVKGLNKG